MDEEKKLHAKDISKIFKFVAPAFVMACAVLKWCSVMPGVDIGELIKAGVFVYAVGGGTIDFNLVVDKLVGLKNGGGK